MLKTILAIVILVTVFGILFFLYVKKSLEKRLNYYLSKNNKKKNSLNHLKEFFKLFLWYF